MPKSRFVAASRLRPLIVYLAGAVLVVMAAQWGVERLDFGDAARQLLALAWIVLFPVGGWLVWRAGREG